MLLNKSLPLLSVVKDFCTPTPKLNCYQENAVNALLRYGSLSRSSLTLGTYLPHAKLCAPVMSTLKRDVPFILSKVEEIHGKLLDPDNLYITAFNTFWAMARCKNLYLKVAGRPLVAFELTASHFLDLLNDEIVPSRLKEGVSVAQQTDRQWYGLTGLFEVTEFELDIQATFAVLSEYLTMRLGDAPERDIKVADRLLEIAESWPVGLCPDYMHMINPHFVNVDTAHEMLKLDTPPDFSNCPGEALKFVGCFALFFAYKGRHLSSIAEIISSLNDVSFPVGFRLQLRAFCLSLGADPSGKVSMSKWSECDFLDVSRCAYMDLESYHHINFVTCSVLWANFNKSKRKGGNHGVRV